MPKHDPNNGYRTPSKEDQEAQVRAAQEKALAEEQARRELLSKVPSNAPLLDVVAFSVAGNADPAFIAIQALQSSGFMQSGELRNGLHGVASLRMPLSAAKQLMAGLGSMIDYIEKAPRRAALAVVPDVAPDATPEPVAETSPDATSETAPEAAPAEEPAPAAAG